MADRTADDIAARLDDAQGGALVRALLHFVDKPAHDRAIRIARVVDNPTEYNTRLIRAGHVNVRELFAAITALADAEAQP
jgi:hypothetical protein